MAGNLIREARTDDGVAVAEIFGYYVANSVVTFEQSAPSTEEWESRITAAIGGGFPFVVAEVDGEVVGYAYASSWRPKPAYDLTVEDTVYVAPGTEGRGLGRRLLADLLDRCRSAGFEQVIAVIADTDSPASARLHESLGFEEVGVLRGVGLKFGRRVDTLLLQRSLRQSPPG